MIAEAILPGWRPGVRLALPRHVRAALWLSYGIAHVLALAWYLRPLSRVAPRVLARMADHPFAPLRSLAQAWKLVVLVEAA